MAKEPAISDTMRCHDPKEPVKFPGVKGPNHTKGVRGIQLSNSNI